MVKIVFLVLAGLLVGGIVLVFLALVMLNLFRPDLFRFEFVGPTNRQPVLAALAQRIADLESVSVSQLLDLPEDRIEHAQLDGRQVLFQITRTLLEDGSTQIVVRAVVKEPPGLFARPLGVAGRGFQVNPARVRSPMTEEHLRELMMNTSGGPFYERSSPK